LGTPRGGLRTVPIRKPSFAFLEDPSLTIAIGKFDPLLDPALRAILNQRFSLPFRFTACGKMLWKTIDVRAAAGSDGRGKL